jgi:hypothetical protein
VLEGKPNAKVEKSMMIHVLEEILHSVEASMRSLQLSKSIE